MAASVDRYRRGLAGVEKEGHVLPNATRAVLEAVEVLHSMLEGSHARLLIGNEAALAMLAVLAGVRLNVVVQPAWRALVTWAVHPGPRLTTVSRV